MLALETAINDKLKEEELAKKQKSDRKKKQMRLHQKEMVCFKFPLAYTLI